MRTDYLTALFTPNHLTPYSMTQPHTPTSWSKEFLCIEQSHKYSFGKTNSNRDMSERNIYFTYILLLFSKLQGFGN